MKKKEMRAKIVELEQKLDRALNDLRRIHSGGEREEALQEITGMLWLLSDVQLQDLRDVLHELTEPPEIGHDGTTRATTGDDP